MKLFKLMLLMFSMLLLLTSSYCEEEEEPDCDRCIEAQRELCEDLLNNLCRPSDTEASFERVENICVNGNSKANAIVFACQLGDNLNCLGFSCE